VAVAVVVAGGSAAGLAGTLPGSVEDASAAKVRHRGGGVAEMQRKLGLPADGVFGPNTERALRRWQRRHGLTADGVAGPATRRAMGIGPGAVLKRGRLRRAGSRRGGQRRPARRSRGSRRARRGGGVRALQRKLGLRADGVFGPQTEKSVKRFQRRHGLGADGVVGPATRRALGMGQGRMLKRRGRRGGSRTRRGSYSVVARVIRAGNRIANAPYRYGGGHASFTDSAYDCSGSVSYALHGGGLLRSPLDSSSFMSYGRPGRGRHITIYAKPGHMYMVVNGRRFDTSARSISGSRWTNVRRETSGYVVRHPAGL